MYSLIETAKQLIRSGAKSCGRRAFFHDQQSYWSNLSVCNWGDNGI